MWVLIVIYFKEWIDAILLPIPHATVYDFNELSVDNNENNIANEIMGGTNSGMQYFHLLKFFVDVNT